MKIYNIPTDVIIYNIFPRVGVESTIMLTKVSKEFHKNKKNLHNYLIQNDDFLRHYTRFYKVDIIRMITESSFSYELFDSMYNYIKHDTNNQFNNPEKEIISEENMKQYQINNTFRIFQLMKLSVNYNIVSSDSMNKDAKEATEVNAVNEANAVNESEIDIRKKKCSNVIVISMKKYFISMYFARNKGRRFFTSFMDNTNVCWERSNVNLYNICENINIISYCKDECEDLKNNLTVFNDTIINNNGFHTADTSVILHKIFVNNFQPKKVVIYVTFIIFRYLNYLFKENLYTKIMDNKKFVISSLNMLNVYEYTINTTSHNALIEPYFKEMILSEIHDYRSNIENN